MDWKVRSMQALERIQQGSELPCLRLLVTAARAGDLVTCCKAASRLIGASHVP